MGEIGPNQRGRVLFMRWQTREENLDSRMAEIDGPVPERSVAQASSPELPAREVGDPHHLRMEDVTRSSGEDERSSRFNRPLDLPDLGPI